jgi:pimeloyl-ACP methyl ester carboxylesterase
MSPNFPPPFANVKQKNMVHKTKRSTLVVAGGADRMTPCTVVERVAARYRSVSTYHVFAEHGHWAFGEPGWQDIARFVLAWLEIHAPPGRTATAASAVP